MENINGNNSKKIIIAFDLDHSIMSGSTIGVPMKKLLNKEIISEIKMMEKQFTGPEKNLAKLQEKVFKILKDKTNTSLKDLEKIVKSISLNKGFAELFNFLREKNNLIDSIIISGNNSVIVEWILEEHGLTDLFPIYYVHFGVPDEELMIKVTECHSHDCDLCDVSQCKGRLLEKYVSENYINREEMTVFFVGDGENDFCVGRYLQSNDILFAREGFELDKIISEKKLKNELTFRCEICLWNDGNYIIDKIKSKIGYTCKF